MPATPKVFGAYLAAAGEGYAMPPLRRRVAAIVRACGVAGHSLDTGHPAIRDSLRSIGRKHGTPSRRAAALRLRSLPSAIQALAVRAFRAAGGAIPRSFLPRFQAASRQPTTAYQR